MVPRTALMLTPKKNEHFVVRRLATVRNVLQQLRKDATSICHSLCLLYCVCLRQQTHSIGSDLRLFFYDLNRTIVGSL